MSICLPNVSRGLGLALGLLLTAAPVGAQEKPAEPRTHKLEIFNGPVRTVHYYADGLSTGERASLSDLQRLENEMAFTNNLANLRNQYVRDERDMQRRRFTVQNLLYGNSTSYSSGFYPGGFGGWGGWGGGFGLPLAYSYPFVGGWGGWGGYSGNAGVTTQSLAFGMGDEGVIKNEMARVLATQSSPAYAAQVRREYHAALDNAANDKRLAGVLGLRKPDGVAPASGPSRALSANLGLAKNDQVTLVLKDGTKVDGKFVEENGDWVTLQTGNEQFSTRLSEVARFTRKTGN